MGSLYRSQHELVFVFKHGHNGHRNNVQLGQFGRNRSNVWHYPGVNSFARCGEEGNLRALHPTVKPVGMVADAILDCSARGDIVIDGFSAAARQRLPPSAPAGAAMGWSSIRATSTPLYGAGRC
jgi:DNA modification methylase